MPIDEEGKRRGLTMVQQALEKYPELREPNPDREAALQDCLETGLIGDKTEDEIDGDTR